MGENAFSGCSALADLDLNEHCTKAQALAVQAYMDAQGLFCYVWRAQNSQSDYPEDGTSVYENGLMIAYTGAQTRIHPYDICDSVQTSALPTACSRTIRRWNISPCRIAISLPPSARRRLRD